MSTEAARRLRQAVVELGGQYSLGDLVEQLINDGLDEAIKTLSQRETPDRLKAGRKLSLR